RELVGRIVDDEIARKPDGRPLAAQQAGAQGVKGGDPHPAAIGSDERFDTAAHFFGSLVRERDRKNFPGLRVAVADQICDAARDDTRLARTRAGEDQQRSADVEHGSALFGVQGVKKLHRGWELGAGAVFGLGLGPVERSLTSSRLTPQLLFPSPEAPAPSPQPLDPGPLFNSDTLREISWLV